jgi:hypothetical protein
MRHARRWQGVTLHRQVCAVGAGFLRKKSDDLVETISS